MVRISSKVSHHRIQQKKEPSLQSIEINSNNTNDQSSSKILNVIRQALLNAAEELVSQQQENENQLDNITKFHTLDNNNNNNDLNKSSCQRNGNAIKKKKKFTCKNKKVLKKNRRK